MLSSDSSNCRSLQDQRSVGCRDEVKSTDVIAEGSTDHSGPRVRWEMVDGRCEGKGECEGGSISPVRACTGGRKYLSS